ncbi:TonB-dependent receptor domain-containing protein [Nodularia sp. UHCC 0506]|uniref:TonB-dependent receptor domain-containing protein n=1 Tax=Nodularia sp. UHCC 0506 TaxID=3110243 RepID=UPI002B1F3766|nr:TonB-dependent receptor [Nodularia sp. UHCC 0506]MEA5516664.1 TonB-dependent receptor [Nodularia sp. UHCC 0506]
MNTIPKSLCIAGLGTIILALLAIAVPAYADITADHEQVTAQVVESEIISITNVKVNSTDTGIEVILETSQPEALEVFFQIEDNKYIADIPNTRLNLANEEEFQQNNPAEEIDSVTIRQTEPNTIQVIVIGKTQPPQLEIVSSNQGLGLNFITTTPESAAITEPEIELQVTAGKFVENVQDVPASITVITGQEVEDSGITSPRDIAKFTPNFSTLRSNGGRTRANYNIRGLGNTSSSNSSGGSAVGLYVDGVPYSDWFSYESALFDVERIEVLRGPQGTLYGQNTQGGVINIITTPPDNFWQGQGSVSYGSPGWRENQLSVRGPLEDNLFLSLSGYYSELDGFVNNTFLDRSADYRQNSSYRGQLRWVSPEKDWDVRLTTNYEEYNDGSLITVPFNSPNPNEIQTDFLGESVVYTNNQSLAISYKGENFDFTSITARRQWANNPGSGDGDFTILDIATASIDVKTLNWSQEFRLQSLADAKPWRWLIGAYLEDKDTEINVTSSFGSDAGTLGFPVGLTQSTPSDFKDTTYALFSQITYAATPQLNLTAGLRFENRNYSINRRSITEIGGFSIPSASDINLADSDSILLPKFAMEYQFNPNLLVYGSIARGYKNGGFSTLPNTPEETQFDRETSWSYELGAKSSWLNNNLLANFSLFFTSVEDYQLIGFVPPNISTIVNANAVDIWGIELETRAKPAKGLDLIASFGYINAEFSDFTDAFGVNYRGNKIPKTPEYTYFLAAQYRSPGGFFSRAELQGIGRYFFEENNQLQQEPLVLVNARIGYERDNFGIYLFSNNLFDKNYFTEAFESFILPGVPFGVPADGRTVGVQVRARF